MTYWDRFHDTGRWQIERSSSTSAVGRLLDLPVGGPIFCRYLTTYVSRMFELVGARDVRTRHTRCRTTGQHECVYTISWR